MTDPKVNPLGYTVYCNTCIYIATVPFLEFCMIIFIIAVYWCSFLLLIHTLGESKPIVVCFVK